ncbi:hypothetical protein [Bacillus sp. MUM 116]|uniref:hypothetical protein n=1 Tax=Bacillus sp. MUM 116 TaxID=1678002 RepID=UPI0015A6A5A4|nr:hypothetical protein [Bacillus sp. MUM 116]
MDMWAIICTVHILAAKNAVKFVQVKKMRKYTSPLDPSPMMTYHSKSIRQYW